jgi:predicted NUDIX family NTP pyrophosphohydrolase
MVVTPGFRVQRDTEYVGAEILSARRDRRKEGGVMAKQSAGILLYRNVNGSVEVFLVHPGGPFWARKDAGVWSIPKGEFFNGQDPLEAARREFHEETGFTVEGEFEPLRPVRQSGKTIYAWAVQGNIDPAAMHSNKFSIEWPPDSGRMQDFPEVDRGEWFSLRLAEQKIVNGQAGLLDQLQQALQTRKEIEGGSKSLAAFNQSVQL